jgi:lysozyme
LTQNQFDALVSFSFNVGVHAFSKSTLLKKLNREDYKGAKREFRRWVYAGGRRLQGLVNRRNQEAQLFLSG